MPPNSSVHPACENTGPTAHPKQPIKKVISINGEEIDVSQQDFNIHDFASFEEEDHLTPRFKSTIRRKAGDLDRKSSFKDVVHDVMRAERIMKALRHYSHRSDSEQDDTEDEMGRNHQSLTDDGETGSLNERREDESNVNIEQVKGGSGVVTDNTINPSCSVNNNVVLDNFNTPSKLIPSEHVSSENEKKMSGDHSLTDSVVDSLPVDNNNLPPNQKETSEIDEVTITITSENEKMMNKRSSSGKVVKEDSLKGDSPTANDVTVPKAPSKCHKCCVVM